MIYLIFILINIGIAYLNNRERLNHIASGNTEQVNHVFWAAIYAAACIPVIIYKPFLGIAVGLLHAVVLPVAYNAFAHIDLFNLSKTTTAKYDQWLIKIGLKNMFIPDLIALLISLFLWRLA